MKVITGETRNLLENRHYQIWSDARAEHVEQTMHIADFRRGSLETSHNARMALLNTQLTRARNGRIHTMKTAQQANAQADYERRKKEIEEAVSKADITTQPVGWGIMHVKDLPHAK